jgi:mRNA interferase MazF
VVVVPITEEARLGIADPAMPIPPTPANGGTRPCFALDMPVTATSKPRIRPTESAITPDQPAAIRPRIGIALGL